MLFSNVVLILASAYISTSPVLYFVPLLCGDPNVSAQSKFELALLVDPEWQQQTYCCEWLLNLQLVASYIDRNLSRRQV